MTPLPTELITLFASSTLSSTFKLFSMNLKAKRDERFATLLAPQSTHYHDILNTKIKSQSGLSILVLPPLPTKVKLHTPGPVFEEVSLTLRILHHPFSHPLTPSLISIAETLSAYLHFWAPPLPSSKSTIQLSTHNPWTFINTFPKTKHNILEIQFSITTHL